MQAISVDPSDIGEPAANLEFSPIAPSQVVASLIGLYILYLNLRPHPKVVTLYE